MSSQPEQQVYIGPRGGLYVRRGPSHTKRYVSQLTTKQRTQLQLPSLHSTIVPDRTFVWNCSGRGTNPSSQVPAKEGTVFFSRNFPMEDGGARLRIEGSTRAKIGPLLTTYPDHSGRTHVELSHETSQAMGMSLMAATSKLLLDSRGPSKVLQQEGPQLAIDSLRTVAVGMATQAGGVLGGGSAGILIDASRAALEGNYGALADAAISAVALRFGVPFDVAIFNPINTTARVDLSGNPLQGSQLRTSAGVGLSRFASAGVSSVNSTSSNLNGLNTTGTRCGAYLDLSALAASAEVGIGVQHQVQSPYLTSHSDGTVVSRTFEDHKIGVGGSVHIADRQGSFFRGFSTGTQEQTIRYRADGGVLCTELQNLTFNDWNGAKAGMNVIAPESLRTNWQLTFGSQHLEFSPLIEVSTSTSSGVMYSTTREMEYSAGQYAASASQRFVNDAGNFFNITRTESGTAERITSDTTSKHCLFWNSKEVAVAPSNFNESPLFNATINARFKEHTTTNGPPDVGSVAALAHHELSGVNLASSSGVKYFRQEAADGYVSRTVEANDVVQLYEVGQTKYHEEVSSMRENVADRSGQYWDKEFQVLERKGSGKREKISVGSNRTEETDEQGDWLFHLERTAHTDGIFSLSDRYHSDTRWGADSGSASSTWTGQAVDNQLVYYESEVVAEYSRNIMTSRNLLFTTTIEDVYMKDMTRALRHHGPTRKTELSRHSRLALDTARYSAVTHGLGFFASTRTGRGSLWSVAGQSLTDGAIAFTSSVGTDKLLPALGNVDIASVVSGAGVNAAYSVLMGHHKQALRQSFEKAASYLLSQAAGLPLSAQSSVLVANGQLFGSRIQSAHTKRKNVDVNVSGVSFGAHFERASTSYKSRDGFYVTKESHGIGGHASFLGVNVGCGWNSGLESSSVIERKLPGGMVEQSWWNRKVSGELGASINLGDRQASYRILPAWKSTKQTFVSRSRDDGRPLETHTNLPMKFVQRAFSPEGHLAASAFSSNNDAVAHAQAVESHDSVANMFDASSPNGRTEHVMETTQEHVVKKKWFGLKEKHWTNHHERGVAVENSTTQSTTFSPDDSELLTRFATDTATSHFHDVNGQRASETIQQQHHSEVQIFSKADNSAFEHREWLQEGITSDGTPLRISRVESDFHRVIADHESNDGKRGIVEQTHNEFMIGSGREIETSSPVVSASGGACYRSIAKQDKVIERTETYQDTRKTSSSTPSSTSSSTYSAGEMRVVSGIETCTIESSSTTRGIVSAQVVSEQTITQQGYTAKSDEHGQTSRVYDNSAPATTPDTAYIEAGGVGSSSSGGAQVLARTKATRTVEWFTDTTDTESQQLMEDGTVQSAASSKCSLNAGASSALGIAVADGLEIVWTKLQRYHENQDLEKRGYEITDPITSDEIVSDFLRLLIDAGEAYAVGIQVQLAQMTSVLGDGLLTVVVTMACGYGLRKACFNGKKAHPTSAVMTAFNAARVAVQLIVTYLEAPCPNIWMWAASQFFSAAGSFYCELQKEGINWDALCKDGVSWNVICKCAALSWGVFCKQMPKLCTEMGITCVATGVSAIAQYGIAYAFGAAATSGLAATAITTVIIPGVVFFGTAKLARWYFQPDHKELKRLLRKYKLNPRTAKMAQLKKAYRKARLATHPDKPGGTAEKFREVCEDFDRITELRIALRIELPSKGSPLENTIRAFRNICQGLMEWGCNTPSDAVERLVIEYLGAE